MIKLSYQMIHLMGRLHTKQCVLTLAGMYSILYTVEMKNNDCWLQMDNSVCSFSITTHWPTTATSKGQKSNLVGLKIQLASQGRAALVVNVFNWIYPHSTSLMQGRQQSGSTVSVVPGPGSWAGPGPKKPFNRKVTALIHLLPWLHVSLSKILNPILLLMSRSATCMAASAIGVLMSVWMDALFWDSIHHFI